jgi:hypothetical protein
LKIKLVVIAVLAAITSAFGVIGDTETQFKARFLAVDQSNPDVIVGFGRYTVVFADFINHSSEGETIAKKDGTNFTIAEVHEHARRYGIDTYTQPPSWEDGWVRKDGRLFIGVHMVEMAYPFSRGDVCTSFGSLVGNRSIRSQRSAIG